jgi:hypothetical protein
MRFLRHETNDDKCRCKGSATESYLRIKAKLEIVYIVKNFDMKISITNKNEVNDFKEKYLI